MENIKLINRCAATLSPMEKEKQQFLFWTEFFVESTESDQEVDCARFPVLIQELTKVRALLFSEIFEHYPKSTHIPLFNILHCQNPECIVF